MNTPLVSIIVNNYNYGRYLCRAIDSALSQTYERKQVIVVDDGSTDDSREQLVQYGSQILIVLKTNGGQASAFNTGLRHASGELVMFLDSDDTLCSDAVQCVVAAWSNVYSKLHYPLLIVDDNGVASGALYPKKPLSEGDVLPHLLRYGTYSTAPTTGNVFARRFLDQVMPIPELEWRNEADCYLLHLAPFFGEVGLIDRALASYRIHPGSESSFAGNNGIRIATLHKELLRDVRQQKLVADCARSFGHAVHAGALLRTYSHYKTRLASLILATAAHPFPEDTVLQLLTLLLRCIWTDKGIRFSKKVVLTIWTFAITGLPLSWSQNAFTHAFVPDRRPALVNTILHQR